MKNIHVLPTDEPSRLYTNMQGILSKDELKIRLKNYNIYITNDEEIKEGDWFIDEFGITKNDTHLKFIGKKIILTTDQDLIDVQSIDDEFLEWFVKNPSCEKVEIERWFDTSHIDLGVGKVYHNNPNMPLYKIIIPKEESKPFKDMLPLTQVDLAEFKKNPVPTKKEPKQETLEEAAEKWIRQPKLISDRESFVAGAKWNQERSYSEEEVRELFTKYKEEFSIYRNMQILNAQFEEWFEQFKKK